MNEIVFLAIPFVLMLAVFIPLKKSYSVYYVQQTRGGKKFKLTNLYATYLPCVVYIILLFFCMYAASRLFMASLLRCALVVIASIFVSWALPWKSTYPWFGPLEAMFVANVSIASTLMVVV